MGVLRVLGFRILGSKGFRVWGFRGGVGFWSLRDRGYEFRGLGLTLYPWVLGTPKTEGHQPSRHLKGLGFRV